MRVEVFCDGALSDGEDKATFGWVMHYDDGEISIGYGYVPDDEKQTVPVAEYYAIYAALKNIKLPKYCEHVTIYSDAQLVINQLNGVFKTKSKHLKRIADMIHKAVTLDYLYENISVEFVWIPREENLADEFSRGD